jgi:RAM signalling pathway protein
MPSFSRSDSPYSTVSSNSSSQFVLPLAPPPLPSKNLDRVNGLNKPSRPLYNPTIMERSRSHSEVVLKPHTTKSRKRAESTHRNRPDTEDKKLHNKHTRDISFDSGTQDEEDLKSSPTEMSQGFGAYFKRLSVMPASLRVSLSAIKLVEASRGILFALSQLQQAAQQYVGLCGDVVLSRTIGRVLLWAKRHVGYLIDALEAHESKGEGADVMPVIEACNACVNEFKKVINALLQHIDELADRADVRLTRTFILLIYGAAVELQNSWDVLRPSLPVNLTSQIPSPIPSNISALPKSASSQANRLKTIVGAPPNITLPPQNFPTKSDNQKSEYSTPSTPFGAPPTPGIESGPTAETDEPLFEKIQMATTTALSVLAYISDEVTKLHTPGQVPTGKEPPSSTLAKLKELAANAVSTGEVTKRLRGRVTIVKERKDIAERRKFWEDTNSFVKVQKSPHTL